MLGLGASYRRSFWLSLLIHGGVLLLALVSLDTTMHHAFTAQKKPQDNVNIVEAVSVNQADVEKQIQAIKHREEQKRQAVLAKQRAAAKAKREREAEIKRQAELKKQRAREAAARKAAAAKAAAEKKRLAELKKKEEARKQAEAEKQRLAAQEKARKAKAAAEAKRKAELAKQQEAERQKQLAEQKRKDELQKQLQAQLEAEQRARAEARARWLNAEVDKYKGMILRSISQRWLIPDRTNPEQTVRLFIRIGPGGIVLDVRLLSSSGDPVLDRSAIAAVYKAAPLPVPEQDEVFDKFRELDLTMRPESVMNS